MPQIHHFTSREDYYAAVNAYFESVYPDAEQDCE